MGRATTLRVVAKDILTRVLRLGQGIIDADLERHEGIPEGLPCFIQDRLIQGGIATIHSGQQDTQDVDKATRALALQQKGGNTQVANTQVNAYFRGWWQLASPANLAELRDKDFGLLLQSITATFEAKLMYGGIPQVVRVPS